MCMHACLFLQFRVSVYVCNGRCPEYDTKYFEGMTPNFGHIELFSVRVTESSSVFSIYGKQWIVVRSCRWTRFSFVSLVATVTLRRMKVTWKGSARYQQKSSVMQHCFRTITNSLTVLDTQFHTCGQWITRQSPWIGIGFDENGVVIDSIKSWLFACRR